MNERPLAGVHVVDAEPLKPSVLLGLWLRRQISRRRQRFHLVTFPARSAAETFKLTPSELRVPLNIIKVGGARDTAETPGIA